MTRHSPCVGVCRLDDATGFCLGCGRSRDEIASWISMDESQRDGVWAKLPARLAALSVGVRMLPWTREELASWIGETISHRRGTWAADGRGATVEFSSAGHHEDSVAADAETIIARTAEASFRLRISDKLRAFAFAGSGQVVLGLPKGRAAVAGSPVVKALGPDTDAIDAAHRNEWLFDLGVGDSTSRFLLRTADAALVRSLSVHSGRRWPEALPSISAELRSANPARIVETAALRIEAFAPMPPPSGQKPASACVDFPQRLLQPRFENSADLMLPDYAALVAIFYPGSAAAHSLSPALRLVRTFAVEEPALA